MKTLSLIILSLLIGKNCLAQDTISIQTLPKAGFTYVVSNDTTTHYTISAPSISSQVWNFSNLIEKYQKVPSYGLTSQTPYQSLFPTSNVYTYGPSVYYSSGFFGSLPVNQGSTNGYVFWKADSSGFWSQGFRPDTQIGSSAVINIQPNELIFPLPGILNDTTDSQDRWSINFNLVASDPDTLYVKNVKKRFIYDAFGKLTTPYGTFNNILRLHEYSITCDSVYYSLGGYLMELSRDTANTYFYFDKNQDYPALTTYADVNNNVIFTEYFKTRVPSTMSTNNLVNSPNINVFPNPFSTQLNCDSDGSASKLLITDIDGKIVATYPLINGRNNLDVSHLSAGVYLAKIMSKEGFLIQSIKLVK